MRNGLAPILFGRPSWVPYGSSLAFDFTQGLGWTPNSVRPAAGMLTTTRASDAYADSASGFWQAFTSGQPRITDKGLLVEEARSNLFVNPSSPATQSITVVSSSVYTVSVVGVGSVTLSDAGTGTASQGSPVTFTAGSTNLTVTTAGITGAFPNVNVELGASATSPIRSTPRAADVILINNFSSWFNQSAGTIYVEAVVPRTVSANAHIVEISNGSNNEEYITYVNSAAGFSFDINDGGGSVAGVFGGTQTANSVFKYAAAYASNDGRLVVNGASVGTPDVSMTLPTVDRAYIGSRRGVAFWLNGYVRRFAYKPVADTAAQMQAITS